MAFAKTGIAVESPNIVSDLQTPKVGEEREGLVWDGEQWVSKSEWEAKLAERKANG